MEPQPAASPRLVRRSHDRMIAGVCGGIADHFNIDPILVRIAFVLATFFGGAGVIAYAAAWVLIPGEHHTTSIAERVMREHRWGRIAGFVLIAIAISSVARPVWWFGGRGLFPVLLIVGGLYLLSPGFSRHDDAPGSPPDLPPATTAEYATGTGGGTATATMTAPPPSAPAAPIGAPRRRRAGLGALTMGVLMIGGGVVGLLLGAGNSVEPTYVFAAGLLIVGAALVASTWFGRSYILIPIGVILVALMSVSSVIDVPLTGGVGHKRETPLALRDLRLEYHLGVGELNLDLSHLTFANGTTEHVKATVGVGHVLVRLPRDVSAEVHGHAGLGDVRFLDDSEGGIRIDRNTTLSASSDGAPRVVIDAQVGVGQVEVQDAAS
ncbi:MAG TPA: PspC domain-containing protein [Acidimicrobiales bacterium]|jgi:phage shock protein PspC (stress-responsive transcriptional regulator)|nr:PspC domain-containing protein [Acidimicrobiales bacterium]